MRRILLGELQEYVIENYDLVGINIIQKDIYQEKPKYETLKAKKLRLPDEAKIYNDRWRIYKERYIQALSKGYMEIYGSWVGLVVEMLSALHYKEGDNFMALCLSRQLFHSGLRIITEVPLNASDEKTQVLRLGGSKYTLLLNRDLKGIEGTIRNLGNLMEGSTHEIHLQIKEKTKILAGTSKTPVGIKRKEYCLDFGGNAKETMAEGHLLVDIAEALEEEKLQKKAKKATIKPIISGQEIDGIFNNAVTSDVRELNIKEMVEIKNPFEVLALRMQGEIFYVTDTVDYVYLLLSKMARKHKSSTVTKAIEGLQSKALYLSDDGVKLKYVQKLVKVDVSNKELFSALYSLVTSLGELDILVGALVTVIKE